MRRAAVAVVLALATLPASAAALSESERALELASFDYVWERIDAVHPLRDMGGVDWQATRDELRPRVARARDADEVRSVLQELVGRLGVSHLAILPRGLFELLEQPGGEGWPGLALRVLDGHAVVVEVEPGGPAEAAGLVAGDRIVAVDERPLSEAIARIRRESPEHHRLPLLLYSAAYAPLAGDSGAVRQLVVEGRNGARRATRLVLSEPPGTRTVAGHLPPLHVRFEYRRLAGGEVYVRFNAFLNPQLVSAGFNEVMAEHGDAPGLVIDLRGNGGGQSNIMLGMLGWLLEPEHRHIGTELLRELSLDLVVHPRARRYRGRVALLVDGLSGSSSELFASAIQESGRGRLFGERSAGGVLASLFERLPNGDGFQYAISDFRSAGGQRLEGVGVTPDRTVHHSREALYEGRDAVLEAALSWLRDDNEAHGESP